MIVYEALWVYDLAADMIFQKTTLLSLARTYKTELSAQRMALHMYACLYT